MNREHRVVLKKRFPFTGVDNSTPAFSFSLSFFFFFDFLGATSTVTSTVFRLTEILPDVVVVAVAVVVVEGLDVIAEMPVICAIVADVADDAFGELVRELQCRDYLY